MDFREKIFNKKAIKKEMKKKQEKRVRRDEEDVYMTCYPEDKDGYKVVKKDDYDPFVDGP